MCELHKLAQEDSADLGCRSLIRTLLVELSSKLSCRSYGGRCAIACPKGDVADVALSSSIAECAGGETTPGEAPGAYAV